MTQKRQITRRRFVADTALATVAGVTAFQIVPNHVLSAPLRKTPPPSDQLRVGNIGVGGRGSGFLRPGVTKAICDVDENHLKQAVERLSGDKDIKLYTNYRKLLEQKDLDAVFVTVPDHWHAIIMVHACEAGKDVYVEKPACKTIEEGLAMIEAAERYARVVQVGSQGRSQEGAYHAKTYIANGQIGTVKEVRCWHYASPEGDWTPNTEPPATLDYDKWLGPLRYIPYNEKRTHARFRWMMYSGGGQIRDRGAHVMSCALWIMNADDTGPVSVETKGHPPYDGMYNTGVDMEVRYEFKNPDWTLVWAQPGEPYQGTEFGRRPVRYGAYYIGGKENLVLTYGDGPGTNTEKRAREYEAPPDGVHVFHSPGHRENFENCIRTREKPIMNITAGYKVAVLCILGNLSMVLGRKLEWDPVKNRVIGDDEANRLLFRPGRGIYHL